ncbi:sulfatase domain-containing protein [Helicobacter cinaedi CCUG 18818 = ATCC BAA-847]|uniref:Arylsulfatase n=1 Tax=Helicobacter cinaedi CCUG 18818 = ATCC BAA-847 TaxID=537971 RepID=A0AAI8QGX2_9HELI|nr:phosphoethanolamine transferase [Helicobacter cinaedi]EFR45754.1 arylsulfatase [Helicobacter cinaedi CCUG 18818 = ATCC BAA-847]BAM33116.1 sulfatase domain-containing protein [Helicobacter cinaedi CCUG 18818 = ATCC BAA-847]
MSDTRFFRTFVLLWLMNTLLIVMSQQTILHTHFDMYYFLTFSYREMMFIVSYGALFGIIYMLKWKSLQNLLLFVVVALSVLCMMAEIFCFYNFSTLLNSYVISIALESNMRESFEFLHTYIDMKLLGMYGLFGLGIWLCFKIQVPKCVRNNTLKLKVVYVLLLLLVMVLHIVSVRPSSPSLRFSDVLYHSYTSLSKSLKYALAFMQEYKRLQTHFDEFAKGFEVKPSKEKIANVVLVIGESTQRGKMSLYGYELPTTPLLWSLKQQKPQNLFAFNDVISSQGSTYESLTQVLTFANQENAQNSQWYEHLNLIDAMRLGGYHTTIISNQEAVSFFGNGVATILNRADEVKYLNCGDSFDLTRFDEELLGVLDTYLKQYNVLPPPPLESQQFSLVDSKSHNEPLRFFALHLMGSHDRYESRYPKEFDIFSPKDIGQDFGDKNKMAAYLNSVLYGDFVLREIIKRFEYSDSLVLYFSDHGEEVYENGDFAGHSNSKMSRFIVEIPFIIYVSDAFIDKHPELYKRLQKAQNQRYMNDDLLHSVLDMLGIEIKDYDKKRSILSDNEFLQTRPRVVGNDEYRKDYDKELVKNYFK